MKRIEVAALPFSLAVLLTAGGCGGDGAEAIDEESEASAARIERGQDAVEGSNAHENPTTGCGT